MKLTANKLIVILGPTASGKTALAHSLASVFGGEIVNADSRQIYKGMNIGTAKPDLRPTTNDQRHNVYIVDDIPYHLFNILEPNEEFSVAQYKKLAIETLQDVQARNKLLFLVGGSGLYIKAVADNLELPEVPAQKELRAMLEQRSEEELLRMLKERDIKAAQIIDTQNKRRLVRALEVIMTTGKPFSEQLQRGPKLFDTLQIALDIPREQLFQNIEQRAQQMIGQGLESEVKALVRKYGWNNVLTSTIGYKEWQNFFEGNKTLNEIKEEIIKNTKLLVKKQYTWFLKQKGIHWVKNEEEAQGLIEKFLQ